MKPISLLSIAFTGWTPDAFPENFAIVRANGLQFAYLETGERGAPLVVCLHGFSDDAFTFSELLPALAEKGYHAIAPFMRGYYPSAIPAKADYSIETLAKDALELIDGFGSSGAVLIGHDWGALAGYAAANLAPERVRKLVTLATPHPRARLPWGMSSERRFTDASGPVFEAQRTRMTLNLARPGRTAAAQGYDRSFRRDLLNVRRLLLYRRKTSVATLAIHGALEGVALREAFARTPSAFTGAYRHLEIPKAGRFVHLEAAELVNSEVLKFLGSAERSSDSN